MKTLLSSHGLQKYVDEGYQEYKDEISLSDSKKKKLKTERMQDAKALYIIQFALANIRFLQEYQGSIQRRRHERYYNKSFKEIAR